MSKNAVELAIDHIENLETSSQLLALNNELSNLWQIAESTNRSYDREKK